MYQCELVGFNKDRYIKINEKIQQTIKIKSAEKNRMKGL